MIRARCTLLPRLQLALGAAAVTVLLSLALADPAAAAPGKHPGNHAGKPKSHAAVAHVKHVHPAHPAHPSKHATKHHVPAAHPHANSHGTKAGAAAPKTSGQVRNSLLASSTAAGPAKKSVNSAQPKAHGPKKKARPAAKNHPGKKAGQAKHTNRTKPHSRHASAARKPLSPGRGSRAAFRPATGSAVPAAGPGASATESSARTNARPAGARHPAPQRRPSAPPHPARTTPKPAIPPDALPGPVRSIEDQLFKVTGMRLVSEAAAWAFGALLVVAIAMIATSLASGRRRLGRTKSG